MRPVDSTLFCCVTHFEIRRRAPRYFAAVTASGFVYEPSETTSWLGLVGPAVMPSIVLAVTGIRPPEARAPVSPGDAYHEHQQTTGVFFPWFPRRPS
jgi:steroid 5-alpha reductase family enzyme